jgi:hypothetical protein
LIQLGRRLQAPACFLNLNRKFVFEFDKWEISLDKPYRYGRRILAHVIEPYAIVEMTRKDMETLFSLLSKTKKEKHNESKTK